MKKSVDISGINQVTHGRNYDYMLKYHIVWCTNKCADIFIVDLVDEVAGYIKETAETLQMDIIRLVIKSGYIHIYADCKPQLRLSDAVKVLKGNISFWLFRKHPELKKNLEKGHMWQQSYFVAIDNAKIDIMIEEYIRR